MDDIDQICDQIEEMDLSPVQCQLLRHAINQILAQKEYTYNIKLFIANVKLQNAEDRKLLSSFSIFNDYESVQLEKLSDVMFSLTIRIESAIEDTWETYISFNLGTNWKVTNIIFQTDRYFRYEYIKHGFDSCGDFQGYDLETYLKMCTAEHAVFFSSFIKDHVSELQKLAEILIIKNGSNDQ